jgi:hypothetical protein
VEKDNALRLADEIFVSALKNKPKMLEVRRESAVRRLIVEILLRCEPEGDLWVLKQSISALSVAVDAPNAFSQSSPKKFLNAKLAFSYAGVLAQAPMRRGRKSWFLKLNLRPLMDEVADPVPS